MSIANNESTEIAMSKEFVLASKPKSNTHRGIYRKFILFLLDIYGLKENYMYVEEKTTPPSFAIKMIVQI